MSNSFVESKVAARCFGQKNVWNTLKKLMIRMHCVGRTFFVLFWRKKKHWLKINLLFVIIITNAIIFIDFVPKINHFFFRLLVCFCIDIFFQCVIFTVMAFAKSNGKIDRKCGIILILCFLIQHLKFSSVFFFYTSIFNQILRLSEKKSAKKYYVVGKTKSRCSVSCSLSPKRNVPIHTNL